MYGFSKRELKLMHKLRDHAEFDLQRDNCWQRRSVWIMSIITVMTAGIFCWSSYPGSHLVIVFLMMIIAGILIWKFSTYRLLTIKLLKREKIQEMENERRSVRQKIPYESDPDYDDDEDTQRIELV